MPSRQVITSGVDYLALIIPVVVALFGWIAAVLWADTHPEVRHVGAARLGLPGGAAKAEATLATGAADEGGAGSGQRIPAGEDAAAQAQSTPPAQPPQAAERRAADPGQPEGGSDRSS